MVRQTVTCHKGSVIHRLSITLFKTLLCFLWSSFDTESLLPLSDNKYVNYQLPVIASNIIVCNFNVNFDLKKDNVAIALIDHFIQI